MKKIASILAALLLPVAVMATTDASADNKPVAPIATGVSPSVPQLLLPNVKGTVAVPASLLVGGFATLDCSHLQVYASSKEMTTCPPGGGFCTPQPKWTRHANATGNIASGQCSYDVIVPPSSAFAVSGASNFSQPNNCGYTYVQSSGTGQTLIVAPKEQKIHNFALTGFTYTTCPH